MFNLLKIQANYKKHGKSLNFFLLVSRTFQLMMWPQTSAKTIYKFITRKAQNISQINNMIESLWQTLIYMITRPCNRPEDLNISQCKQLFITEALNAKFNRKIDKLFKLGKQGLTRINQFLSRLCYLLGLHFATHRITNLMPLS